MNNSKSLAEAIRQANEERFRFAELVSQYWQDSRVCGRCGWHLCEGEQCPCDSVKEPVSKPTEAQIVAVADVLLAWEAEISNRVSARVLAEDVIRAALAAKENNDADH